MCIRDRRCTQGGRLHTTVQVWIATRLRGARAGRSKSRHLASKDGVAFCGPRAGQVNGKPTLKWHVFGFSLCCCICCKEHTSPQNVYTMTQPRYNSSRALSFSVFGSHEQCFCVCVSVCVCATEPRILHHAVGTTVPGTTVGTQQRAVQLIPFFRAVLCSLRLLCICESNRAPSYIYTSWQPQQPHFKVLPL